MTDVRELVTTTLLPSMGYANAAFHQGLSPGDLIVRARMVVSNAVPSRSTVPLHNSDRLFFRVEQGSTPAFPDHISFLLMLDLDSGTWKTPCPTLERMCQMLCLPTSVGATIFAAIEDEPSLAGAIYTFLFASKFKLIKGYVQRCLYMLNVPESKLVETSIASWHESILRTCNPILETVLKEEIKNALLAVYGPAWLVPDSTLPTGVVLRNVFGDAKMSTASLDKMCLFDLIVMPCSAKRNLTMVAPSPLQLANHVVYMGLCIEESKGRFRPQFTWITGDRAMSSAYSGHFIFPLAHTAERGTCVAHIAIQAQSVLTQDVESKDLKGLPLPPQPHPIEPLSHMLSSLKTCILMGNFVKGQKGSHFTCADQAFALANKIMSLPTPYVWDVFRMQTLHLYDLLMQTIQQAILSFKGLLMPRMLPILAVTAWLSSHIRPQLTPEFQEWLRQTIAGFAWEAAAIAYRLRIMESTGSSFFSKKRADDPETRFDVFLADCEELVERENAQMAAGLMFLFARFCGNFSVIPAAKDPSFVAFAGLPQMLHDLSWSFRATLPPASTAFDAEYAPLVMEWCKTLKSTPEWEGLLCSYQDRLTQERVTRGLASCVPFQHPRIFHAMPIELDNVALDPEWGVQLLLHYPSLLHDLLSFVPTTKWASTSISLATSRAPLADTPVATQFVAGFLASSQGAELWQQLETSLQMTERKRRFGRRVVSKDPNLRLVHLVQHSLSVHHYPSLLDALRAKTNEYIIRKHNASIEITSLAMLHNELDGKHRGFGRALQRRKDALVAAATAQAAGIASGDSPTAVASTTDEFGQLVQQVATFLWLSRAAKQDLPPALRMEQKSLDTVDRALQHILRKFEVEGPPPKDVTHCVLTRPLPTHAAWFWLAHDRLHTLPPATAFLVVSQTFGGATQAEANVNMMRWATRNSFFTLPFGKDKMQVMRNILQQITDADFRLLGGWSEEGGVTPTLQATLNGFLNRIFADVRFKRDPVRRWLEWDGPVHLCDIEARDALQIPSQSMMSIVMKALGNLFCLCAMRNCALDELSPFSQPVPSASTGTVEAQSPRVWRPPTPAEQKSPVPPSPSLPRSFSRADFSRPSPAMSTSAAAGAAMTKAPSFLSHQAQVYCDIESIVQNVMVDQPLAVPVRSGKQFALPLDHSALWNLVYFGREAKAVVSFKDRWHHLGRVFDFRGCFVGSPIQGVDFFFSFSAQRPTRDTVNDAVSVTLTLPNALTILIREILARRARPRAYSPVPTTSVASISIDPDHEYLNETDLMCLVDALCSIAAQQGWRTSSQTPMGDMMNVLGKMRTAHVTIAGMSEEMAQTMELLTMHANSPQSIFPGLLETSQLFFLGMFVHNAPGTPTITWRQTLLRLVLQVILAPIPHTAAAPIVSTSAGSVVEWHPIACDPIDFRTIRLKTGKFVTIDPPATTVPVIRTTSGKLTFPTWNDSKTASLPAKALLAMPVRLDTLPTEPMLVEPDPSIKKDLADALDLSISPMFARIQLQQDTTLEEDEQRICDVSTSGASALMPLDIHDTNLIEQVVRAIVADPFTKDQIMSWNEELAGLACKHMYSAELRPFLRLPATDVTHPKLANRITPLLSILLAANFLECDTSQEARVLFLHPSFGPDNLLRLCAHLARSSEALQDDTECCLYYYTNCSTVMNRWTDFLAHFVAQMHHVSGTTTRVSKQVKGVMRYLAAMRQSLLRVCAALRVLETKNVGVGDIALDWSCTQLEPETPSGMYADPDTQRTYLSRRARWPICFRHMNLPKDMESLVSLPEEDLLLHDSLLQPLQCRIVSTMLFAPFDVLAPDEMAGSRYFRCRKPVSRPLLDCWLDILGHMLSTLHLSTTSFFVGKSTSANPFTSHRLSREAKWIFGNGAAHFPFAVLPSTSTPSFPILGNLWVSMSHCIPSELEQVLCALPEVKEDGVDLLQTQHIRRLLSTKRDELFQCGTAEIRTLFRALVWTFVTMGHAPPTLLLNTYAHYLLRTVLTCVSTFETGAMERHLKNAWCALHRENIHIGTRDCARAGGLLVSSMHHADAIKTVLLLAASSMLSTEMYGLRPGDERARGWSRQTIVLCATANRVHQWLFHARTWRMFEHMNLVSGYPDEQTRLSLTPLGNVEIHAATRDSVLVDLNTEPCGLFVVSASMYQDLLDHDAWPAFRFHRVVIDTQWMPHASWYPPENPCLMSTRRWGITLPPGSNLATLSPSNVVCVCRTVLDMPPYRTLQVSHMSDGSAATSSLPTPRAVLSSLIADRGVWINAPIGGESSFRSSFVSPFSAHVSPGLSRRMPLRASGMTLTEYHIKFVTNDSMDQIINHALSKLRGVQEEKGQAIAPWLVRTCSSLLWTSWLAFFVKHESPADASILNAFRLGALSSSSSISAGLSEWAEEMRRNLVHDAANNRARTFVQGMLRRIDPSWWDHFDLSFSRTQEANGWPALVNVVKTLQLSDLLRTSPMLSFLHGILTVLLKKAGVSVDAIRAECKRNEPAHVFAPLVVSAMTKQPLARVAQAEFQKVLVDAATDLKMSEDMFVSGSMTVSTESYFRFLSEQKVQFAKPLMLIFTSRILPMDAKLLVTSEVKVPSSASSAKRKRDLGPKEEKKAAAESAAELGIRENAAILLKPHIWDSLRGDQKLGLLWLWSQHPLTAKTFSILLRIAVGTKRFSQKELKTWIDWFCKERKKPLLELTFGPPIERQEWALPLFASWKITPQSFQETSFTVRTKPRRPDGVSNNPANPVFRTASHHTATHRPIVLVYYSTPICMYIHAAVLSSICSLAVFAKNQVSIFQRPQTPATATGSSSSSPRERKTPTTTASASENTEAVVLPRTWRHDGSTHSCSDAKQDVLRDSSIQVWLALFSQNQDLALYADHIVLMEQSGETDIQQLFYTTRVMGHRTSSLHIHQPN